MKSRRIIYVLLALGVASTISCTAKNEYQQPPPPEVTVANPVPGQITEVADFTGYCDASERIQVRARVEGFVEQYLFNEGDPINEGDPVVTIDSKPFEATLAQAEAAQLLAEAEVKNAESGVTQAQARAANADTQYRRGERTREGGGISEAELEDLRTDRATAIADFRAAEARVESAKAQVEVAKAQVAQAKLNLGYTRVFSPLTGRVGRQMVDVGNLVGAGEATQLAEIIQYDPAYVYFTVTEREFLEHIRSHPEKHGNKSKSLREQKVPVRLALEGEEGFPHLGYLNFSANEIDSSTGTYLLRAEFENPDYLIPPGAFARVQVSGDEQDVLLVPDSAISRSPSGAFVIVVDENNKCQRRDVRLGRVINEGRVILDGLTADDRIVVNGLQKARPGAVVRATMQTAVEAAPPTAVEP